MTETQLANACKKNDPQAQRLLYDRYAALLYVVCYRYVATVHDAEEILSDAFLKCFKNIDRFEYREEGSLRAWLQKIAVNECLMFLRKQKKLVTPIEQHPELPVAEEALANMEAATIMKHITTLPPGYRTVLNLYVFEDRSHKEIAEILGISESTSKTQLLKARHLLKQKIDQYA